MQKRVKKLSYLKFDWLVATTLQTLDSTPNSLRGIISTKVKITNLLSEEIKYEIRLSESNRPMSAGPKKVESIFCVGPLTE